MFRKIFTNCGVVCISQLGDSAWDSFKVIGLLSTAVNLVWNQYKVSTAQQCIEKKNILDFCFRYLFNLYIICVSKCNRNFIKIWSTVLKFTLLSGTLCCSGHTDDTFCWCCSSLSCLCTVFPVEIFVYKHKFANHDPPRDVIWWRNWKSNEDIEENPEKMNKMINWKVGVKLLIIE
jgi:hypothetical protein